MSQFTQNWSISKLFLYEECPLRFKLKYIERLPEPEPKANSPLERGDRIHKNLEAYVKGEGSLQGNEAKRLDAFKPALEHLQTLHSTGQATSEEDWFFDVNWQETARQHVWLWNKLDFSVKDEEKSLVITGDYKSGKSKYKTVNHIQQTQSYVAASAIKYPWANYHVAELWYVDEGWVRQAKYTREEALKFIGRFDARAQKIYAERFWRPNPNKVTCKWCPYGPQNGTGACPVGV